MGSSKPTKTGQTVLELQNRLPNARIVYASATGASEPKNMAYMTRLGLWGAGTPFPEFNDFIQAVEKRYMYIKTVNFKMDHRNVKTINSQNILKKKKRYEKFQINGSKQFTNSVSK